jgi:endonuclease G, mitochondrial
MSSETPSKQRAPFFGSCHSLGGLGGLGAIVAMIAVAGCATPWVPPPVTPPPPPPIEEPPPPPPIEEPPPPPASVHLALGVPVDGTPADDVLLDYAEMAIGYSPYLNAANWVSWRTTAADFGDVPRYGGSFLSDASLPDGLYRPKDGDYTGAGFDRGHMVRSEERTSTAAKNKATFVLSNILPQTARLNRGPWADFERELEDKVRKPALAQAKDAYVIAGAIWPAACATHRARVAGDGCRDLGKSKLPAERIAVPEATFKILVLIDAGQPVTRAAGRQILAVVMPNVEQPPSPAWTAYTSTVEEIERLTGYDLLSALD